MAGEGATGLERFAQGGGLREDCEEDGQDCPDDRGFESGSFCLEYGVCQRSECK